MDIKWSFDEEGIDPIDPIGNISISNGKATILARYVYLDSWFEALIAGLKEVQAGKHSLIDLVEEPDPLVLKPLHGGVEISYRTTSVFVDSVDEFSCALRTAVKEFSAEINLCESDRDELLKSMRQL